MSYGSLSSVAVQALNRGAKLAGCFQNTGEGGLSPHHLQGGDLIFQIGTGYFGCRELDGRFSLPRLIDLVQAHPQRVPEAGSEWAEVWRGSRGGDRNEVFVLYRRSRA